MKAAKEAAAAADGQADSQGQGEEAVKEAQKIAGQASATKVKRARNGSRHVRRPATARAPTASRSKPRTKN